jgi:hypothetical protein
VLLKALTWLRDALVRPHQQSNFHGGLPYAHHADSGPHTGVAVMNKPMLELKLLSPSGIAVMGQLFVCGPVADGNIIDKNGRRELIHLGLALRAYGWATLTEEGMRVAIEWNHRDLHRRNEVRWLEKLRRS